MLMKPTVTWHLKPRTAIIHTVVTLWARMPAGWDRRARLLGCDMGQLLWETVAIPPKGKNKVTV